MFSSTSLFWSNILGVAILGVGILGIGFLSPNAYAAETKIAVVDLEEALAQSSPGKVAQKEYEVEVRKAQKELDEKKEDLERMQEEFQRQHKSLSAKAKVEKEEDLIRLEKDLKRTFRDSQEELRRRNAQIVGELVREIRDVVHDLGKEKGFDLVLDKRGQSVLFGSDKVDLTEEVVARFNKRSR